MNLRTLNENNYIILNGKVEKSLITKVEDKLIFRLVISGDNWGCNYGDYDLAEVSFKGIDSIVAIMDTLDVEELSELNGVYLRVAAENADAPVKIVGNIIYDKWFNYDDYYISELDDDDVEIIESPEDLGDEDLDE